jgi:hypothetical protein
MFLEHDDVDAGAREQEAEHEPARSPADDAATGGELFDWHLRLSMNLHRRRMKRLEMRGRCAVPAS